MNEAAGGREGRGLGYWIITACQTPPIISKLIKTSLFNSIEDRSDEGVALPGFKILILEEVLISPIAALFKFLTVNLLPSMLVISALKDAVWEEKSLPVSSLADDWLDAEFWVVASCLPAKNPIESPRINKARVKKYQEYFFGIDFIFNLKREKVNHQLVLLFRSCSNEY